MSQKLTRKSQNAAIVIEDREKVDSPVKEMKKKVAANAEKEKQAAEKADKPAEKTDKTEPADKNKTADKNKPAEKTQKDTEKTENSEKTEKVADKKSEKSDKGAEKKVDKVIEKKTDKPIEKKTEKPIEKKADKPLEKKADKPIEKKADKPIEKKADKSMEKKTEQMDKDDSKSDKTKEKPPKPLNGTHNGTQPANGAEDTNGTVSDGSEDDLVIEEDELFPELTYEDSDTENYEADAPSRSFTRRSQVKVTKTPETPRPASEKESEESKVMKLIETPLSDRKLRSADSPKPESKKLEKKAHDSPKKQEGEEEEKKSKKDVEDADKEESKDGTTGEKLDKLEMEVVVEIENAEGTLPRTRARVSPYTRTRLERTHSSAMADYTGNNSTMEMDITETSSVEEPSLNDSSYLRGLRGIRGRTSYKLLRELHLTNPNANRPRPAVTIPVSAPVAAARPTGAVVGRKRKPSPPPSLSPAPGGSPVELAAEASDEMFTAHGKRMKLLDRLSMPFRRNTRRAAEIVGINTDLPLTAPVASTSSFDPETIKPLTPSEPLAPLATPLTPLATPLQDRDAKRCVIM